MEKEKLRLSTRNILKHISIVIPCFTILPLFAWSAESPSAGLVQEALKQYRAKDYSAALEIARQAVERDTGNGAAHHIYGLALAKQGLPLGAEQQLKLATDLSPKRADYFYDWGLNLSNQKKYDSAIPILRRAIELDATHLESRFLLGLMYVSRDRKIWIGNFGQLALEQFQFVEEKRTRFPLVHYYIGKIHLTHGHAEEALRELRQELEFYPGHSQARRELAEVLLKLRQPEEALIQLQKAHEQAPPTANSLYLQAKALRELSRSEEAKGAVERAIKADPNKIENYYLLAQIYQDLRQLELAQKALETFSRLRQQAPVASPSLQ